MTTECMYVLKTDNLEEAKEFCKRVNKLAIKREEEVIPTYISKALKDFRVTPDYDGFSRPFMVKKGTLFVWAYGKDYCMHRLRPKGARKCFPYALNETGNGLMIDLYKCIYDDEIMYITSFERCDVADGFWDNVEKGE